MIIHGAMTGFCMTIVNKDEHFCDAKQLCNRKKSLTNTPAFQIEYDFGN